MRYHYKHALSLRFLKIIFLVIFIPMLLMAVIYYWIAYQNCKAILQERLINLAKGITVAIDPIQLQQLETHPETDCDAYITLNHYLYEYREQVNVRYVYILKKDWYLTREKNIPITRFVIDGGQTGAIDQSHIGQIYHLNPYMEKAFSGEAAVTEKPYTDIWGVFLTGYAPVVDSDGHVAHIVAVDIDASDLKDIQNKLALNIIIIFMVCLGIALLLAHYFALKETEQITKIQKMLERAGRGDFSIWEPDHKEWVEFEVLIANFNKTIARIKILMDKAHESNRLKSEFISTMSHELRTPLNSIIGYTELVLKQAKDTLSSKQTEQLRNVSRNGRHLLEMIDQILEFCAIEAGKSK